MLTELLERVPQSLRHRSGAVFYSGRSAFAAPSKVYLLGLNPGGDANSPDYGTVGSNIDAALRRGVGSWSEYKDEPWEKPYGPGGMPMQRRVRHLLHAIGYADVGSVPASNVVFVRSKRESALASEKAALLAACWPIHQQVIDGLGVRVIVCLGATAGKWVRQQLGAHAEAGKFTEQNRRRWTSWVHQNGRGLSVATLTHPSIADWTTPAADPSEMVRAALARC